MELVVFIIKTFSWHSLILTRRYVGHHGQEHGDDDQQDRDDHAGSFSRLWRHQEADPGYADEQGWRDVNLEDEGERISLKRQPEAHRWTNLRPIWKPLFAVTEGNKFHCTTMCLISLKPKQICI